MDPEASTEPRSAETRAEEGLDPHKKSRKSKSFRSRTSSDVAGNPSDGNETSNEKSPEQRRRKSKAHNHNLSVEENPASLSAGRSYDRSLDGSLDRQFGRHSSERIAERKRSDKDLDPENSLRGEGAGGEGKRGGDEERRKSSGLSVEGLQNSSKEKIGSQRGSTRSTKRRNTQTILDAMVFDLTPGGSILLSSSMSTMHKPDTDRGEASSSPPPSHSSSSIAMAPHLVERARSQAAALAASSTSAAPGEVEQSSSSSSPPKAITTKKRSQKSLRPPPLGSSSDETIPPGGNRLGTAPKKRRPSEQPSASSSSGTDRLSKDNLQHNMYLGPQRLPNSQASSISGESQLNPRLPIGPKVSAFSASSGSDKQSFSLKPMSKTQAPPKKSRSLTFKSPKNKTRARKPVNDRTDSTTDPGTDIEKEPLKTEGESSGTKRATLQRQSEASTSRVASSEGDPQEPTSRLAKFLARYEAGDLTLEIDDDDDDDDDFLSAVAQWFSGRKELRPEAQAPHVPGARIELRKGRRTRQGSSEPKVWIVFTLLTISSLLKIAVLFLDIVLMVKQVFETTLTKAMNGVLFGVFFLSAISMGINYYSILKRKTRSIFFAALLFFPIVVFEIIFASVLVAFQDTFQVIDEEEAEISVRSIFRMFALLILNLEFFQMLTCMFEFRLCYQIRKSRREETLVFVKRETLPDDHESTI